ncbi:MAG: hypothetical protein WCH78_13005 [Bacteroidota bacterium]
MPKRLLWIFLISLFACGEKKIDLSGATQLKPKDFLSVFPIIANNFIVADSNFTKIADTSKIGLKAITQFIPDTVIAKFIGKEKNPNFYAVGKILKEKETYLLLNIVLRHKTEMIVLVLDSKNNHWLASKSLLDNSTQDDYVHSLNINKEPTFLQSQEKNSKDNLVKFSRVGWVYASGVGFMVVVNDSNESPSKSNIINPIDTLTHKNKYSADFEIDTRNFISIRDGKNASNYTFFIHFEKNEGSCIGELKGEFKMKDSKHGVYTFNGDPCVIDFNFEDQQVTVKETGACGNHRGIKCFFDDQYTRKKEPRNKKNK